MNSLDELRARIDAIDSEIFALFAERMRVSDEIAEVKRFHGSPVLDSSRERQKIASAMDAVPDDMRQDAAELMECLMRVSRGRQGRSMGR